MIEAQTRKCIGCASLLDVSFFYTDKSGYTRKKCRKCVYKINLLRLNERFNVEPAYKKIYLKQKKDSRVRLQPSQTKKIALRLSLDSEYHRRSLEIKKKYRDKNKNKKEYKERNLTSSRKYASENKRLILSSQRERRKDKNYKEKVRKRTIVLNFTSGNRALVLRSISYFFGKEYSPSEDLISFFAIKSIISGIITGRIKSYDEIDKYTKDIPVNKFTSPLIKEAFNLIKGDVMKNEKNRKITRLKVDILLAAILASEQR